MPALLLLLRQKRQRLLQRNRQIIQSLGVEQLKRQLIEQCRFQRTAALLRRQKRLQILQQSLHTLTEIANLHTFFRQCAQLCEHTR